MASPVGAHVCPSPFLQPSCLRLPLLLRPPLAACRCRCRDSSFCPAVAHAFPAKNVVALTRSIINDSMQVLCDTATHANKPCCPRSYIACLSCTCMRVPCLLVDVQVCPGGQPGPLGVKLHSPHSRLITQAGGHAPDICGATIRNPLRKAGLPARLPAWTLSLCGHRGRAYIQHCRPTRFDATVASGHGK